MNFSSLKSTTYFHTGNQLWEHLKGRISRAQAVRSSERAALRTPQALAEYTAAFREAFLAGVGGLPGPVGGVPPFTITGRLERPDYAVEKVVFEPRPGVHATGNLYLPANLREPGAAVLFLCGHSNEGKGGARYRQLCHMLARRGLAVLILDPLGQGERYGYYDAASGKTRIRCGTGEHEYVGAQCTLRGENLSRYMLHDAMRAIDFLCAHPLVDPARIGVTGSSGGGTQTLLLMALEPRIAAAAPTTSLSSRLSIFDSGMGQDAEQIWPGFSAAGYDHADFLAAFAPKPVSVQSVAYDFFPIEGTREQVAAARPLWGLFGREAALQATEDPHLHQYTDRLGAVAAEFFACHLGPLPEPAPEPGERAPTEAEICCTRTGQVLGDFPQSRTVFMENRDAYLATKAAPQREAALGFLREAVARGREVGELNLRVHPRQPYGEVEVQNGFWWSQRGVLNSGLFVFPWRASGRLPVTLALWEGGTRALDRHDAFLRREVRAGRAVLVVDLSGMGSLEPQQINGDPLERNTLFRYADDLLTLGDSFAALRIHDVLRALEALPHWGGFEPGPVRLYGHGRPALYAALAAALANPADGVELVDAPPSYEELLTSQYYDDREVKTILLPGLPAFADWVNLIPQRPGTSALPCAKEAARPATSTPPTRLESRAPAPARPLVPSP